MIIETVGQFEEEAAREERLKAYLVELEKLEADILGDMALTNDDKTSLVPSDQITNARYVLSNLKCGLDDFAAREDNSTRVKYLGSALA